MNTDISANIAQAIPPIPSHMKDRILNAVRDTSARFGFVPSPALREMVTKNEHPFIVPLARKIKAAILFCREGQVVGPLSRDLVKDYLLGTLDERTKFVFDHSDIRVIGAFDIGTKVAGE